MSRLETKPPKIRENRSSKTTAEERATVTTTLHSDVSFEFLRRESWNCSEDYEFTHDQKPYKNNLDTFPLPVQEKCYSILSSKRLKNKSGKQKKTEFIQKIKEIFGFSFKESSTAKPRRLKVTQKTENTQLLSRKSNTTE